MSSANPPVSKQTTLATSFILSHLKSRRASAQSRPSESNAPPPPPPLLVGLSGLQGSGKTTLASQTAAALLTTTTTTTTSPTNTTKTHHPLVMSIDDFYLPRPLQRALAASHPANPLVQVRGQPGTHDMALLRDTLSSLLQGKETRVPRYDKSACGGLGDRVPEGEWAVVNRQGEEDTVSVVILEGWCLGFRSLPDDQLEARLREAVATHEENPQAPGQLHKHTLANLSLINSSLRTAGYESIWAMFDAFIHLDAADTAWVYAWRAEQERALLASRGSGMSEEGVRKFVDAYYPAYELYLPGLRRGVLWRDGERNRRGCMLRIAIDKGREVVGTAVDGGEVEAVGKRG